jgi:signal transduction histidine kinase
MVVARRLLALLNGDGVSRSVTEYSRLMQAAAAGRVRDLEAALAELNELQRQRNDAWREAAHDLRNSVGLVSNATGILRRDDAPDPVRAKSLAALQTGVSSLATMLNDLLTLARLEAGQEQRDLTEFDAGRLLSGLCARMQKDFAARGLFLHIDGAPGLTVQGDEENTERIAQSLLQNALRSTRAGGVIVRWSAAEEGDFRRWVLTVQDTGPDGHSAAASPVIEELRQIAESKRPQPDANGAEATRTAGPLSGRGHGEGIGLSIVKHLCELLDARLELSADGAGGSTFRVVLPARYDQH